MYKIIHDEQQLLQASQLFCHDSPHQEDAVKILFLNAREKYLSDEQRSQIHFTKSSNVLSLRTFRCNRPDSCLVSAIRKMEIALGAYEDRGTPIPNEALVLYFSLHSKSSTAAFFDVAHKATRLITSKFYATGDSISVDNVNLNNLEQVLISTIHAAKPCKGRENRYLDLYIDTKDKQWLGNFIQEMFPVIQDSIKCIIETFGGFHIVLVASILGKRHGELMKYLGRKEHTFIQPNRAGESKPQTIICLNSDAQVPCVGTYQGMFPVSFFDLNEFIDTYKK